MRDGGVRGIVINMSEGFKEITWPDEETAVVGAGVRLVEILGECRTKALSGLEFAAGIPATVGGAVAMNAGAHGYQMADVVEGVEFLNSKGKRGFIPADEIGFGYRKTALPKRLHHRKGAYAIYKGRSGGDKGPDGGVYEEAPRHGFARPAECGLHVQEPCR